MNSNPENRLLWCDLEMTGLDPATCHIIEMGLVVTDDALRPVDEFERAVWQPEDVLARMEPYVRDMHTRNGLLDRVRKSQWSLRNVESEALQFVLKHYQLGEGILAGNSIHTDRAFLIRHMPAFDRFLHYRMVDVTSLKVLCRAWYPKAPGRTKADSAHTVLSDLRASISELAFYRQTFFRRPEEVPSVG